MFGVRDVFCRWQAGRNARTQLVAAVSAPLQSEPFVVTAADDTASTLLPPNRIRFVFGRPRIEGLMANLGPLFVPKRLDRI
jgi:hypothetical protein